MRRARLPGRTGCALVRKTGLGSEQVGVTGDDVGSVGVDLGGSCLSLLEFVDLPLELCELVGVVGGHLGDCGAVRLLEGFEL